jgi:hypothetical protein
VHRWAVACLLATAACLLAVAQANAAAPVPSLTPKKTHALWERLVHARKAHPRALLRTADCRPSRVVVYAQTDWLRLATKLAQSASPCAQYYVSVPPLTSDKTKPRPGQAAKIRALGSNFHALAEINWNGWNRWVSATQSNWAQAGIVARQRMAAAGYDVAAGDTWALNEVTSAVRKNTGVARRNVRDLVRGLFTGDGTLPTAKGVVFVIGAAQSMPDVSLLKASLQSWYQDAGFWSDMSAYVSDWGQEVYGDARDYAVEGATPQQRRDVLERYLGHPIMLARAAPPDAATAAGFLDASYLPLGNAAWAWGSSYGWTQLPYQQMQDYVSAQVYAARSLSAADAAPLDRIGFAWAPYNSLGLARRDFTGQTAAILDRLGAAIRDSADTIDPADPGVGACGPLGQPSWCSTVLAGAVFPAAWANFATWTLSTLGFASPPLALTAGTASSALTIQLQTGTVPTPALSPVTVSLASTSPQGAFSTSPEGPWSPTLDVVVPTGSSNAVVYYLDTTAGTPTVSATVAGQPAATQVETVAAGLPTGMTVVAGAATVLEGGEVPLTLTATDSLGNPVTTSPTWTVAPASAGRVVSAGGAATFVAGTTPGQAVISASIAGITGSTAVTVNAPPPKVAWTKQRFVHKHLVVKVKVVAGSKAAAGVPLRVQVRKGSSPVADVKGKTSKLGIFTWRSPSSKLPRGHYVVKTTLPKH